MSYVVVTERSDGHRVERSVHSDRRSALEAARSRPPTFPGDKTWVVPADNLYAFVTHQSTRGAVQVNVDSGWRS